MKIAIMLICEDDAEHYGVARDAFNEAHGYGRRQLAQLYKKARKDLEVKIAFFKEREEKK